MGFSRHKIPRSSTYTISEETAIRFRHPIYNLDRAQKLISSSMSRHLSTRNISSKSMHAFFSNLANRQTDKHGQKHLPPMLSEVIISYSITQSYRLEVSLCPAPSSQATELSQTQSNWSGKDVVTWLHCLQSASHHHDDDDDDNDD